MVATDSRDSRPRSPLTWAAIAAVGLTGLLLRVWAIVSPAGTLDADMAVIGLMGRHFREGEVFVFHWGQAYGGSHEAMLAAVAFTLFGASAPVLQMVTVVLSAVVAVLVWLIGRETVGATAAPVAGLLFWIWPAAFVWWAVKPGSDYWASLSFALAAIVVLLWLANGRRAGPAWFAVLGLFVGLSWWGNPSTVALLVPAAAWKLRFLLRNWKLAPFTVIGAVVGGTPWIAYNLRNNFRSLDLPPTEFGYLERVVRTLTTSGPMALGLRVPFTREWLVPRFVYLLFFALLVVAIIRRPRGYGLLLFLMVLLPLLLPVSPLSHYVDQPRYLLFASPIVALLLGGLLAAGPRWLTAAGLAAALGLSVLGMRGLAEEGVTASYAPDVRMPREAGDARRLLRDHGVKAAFADYWISYRVTFESAEELIVSPIYTIRHKPFDAQVRAVPSPPYLFLTESKTMEHLLERCRVRGTSCPVVRRGAFSLVRPADRIVPEEIPEDLWKTP